MPLSRKHLEEPIERFRKDPELYAELNRKLAEPTEEMVEAALPRVERRRAAPSLGAPSRAVPRAAVSITELVDDKGDPTFRGRAVAETIVKANARPVLIIRDNHATAEFVGPDSAVWGQRIMDAQDRLDRVIPSVGRVELNNNPDYPWVGTGWMIAADIIVTNRHVAREFGRLGPGGFTFRLGVNNAPQSASLDFLEEFQRAASLVFTVESILWIATPTEPDVAFLRVKRGAGDGPLPRQIELAEAIAVDEFVAAIGYPARDPRVPDQDLVRSIFGDVYEKKRLAPGQIMDVKDDELEHDCSTLGGNSGSVLVNLATGQAVGLHFSGLFLEANFAVPAPKLKELLLKAQKAELPGMGTPVVTPPTPLAGAPMDGSYTFRFNIPIEVTVRVGSPLSAGGVPAVIAPPSGVVPSGTGSGSVDQAVALARQTFAGDPDVLEIRAGYRFKNGWITDERVVVVELREKLSMTELAAAHRTPLPREILGVGVDVRTAGLATQLESFGIDLAALEAVPRGGLYREPDDLKLERVKEKMHAIFHVSPDSGWPNLRAFLGRVKKALTATIYEWEAEHISAAIEAAMEGAGHTLTMVTMPKFGIAEGTEDAVADMRQRIGKKFRHVFASVGSGKLIPSAYHIKVASRDGEEFWLSSGNWKDSNQADIDPAGENSTKIGPLRKHNREWHAIIANEKLATIFQEYIEFDFDEAERVPFEEGRVVALPDVFVPEAALLESEAPGAVEYFDPLEIDRVLDVQPLLTPDRNGRHQHLFIRAATKMVADAKEKVYVENQSFSINDENDEYEAFFTTLRDKQQAGVDVRIIFRDPRKFPKGEETLSKTLEKVKDFGLATDEDSLKIQLNCHTKGIVVDGKQVLLGSQNLTAGGSLFNRDASLLVRDEEVAAYFEKVFLFDWHHLAAQNADEVVGGIRLAMPGEATPPGFRRISLAELVGGD
jgi:S1-C subfamily serine protease